mgnify:FL=1
MKQTLIILTILIFNINLFGQTTYAGFIDKYPIVFVTDIYSDGDARAFYVYTKFDDPIRINGNLKNGLLKLTEKNGANKDIATLIFKDYNSKSNNIEGIWKDISSNKELKITLTKSFDIDFGDRKKKKSKELLQPTSLKDKYFKLIISKEKNRFYAIVTGLKIFEKKTDKLIQQIDLECQLWGIDNISIDDYNFDGISDFSVFEQSYAGPNTSSLYFLCDKQTNTYFESEFGGTSLEFDSKNKKIYERNQCCAGASVTTAEYKVVKNKMVLLKEHCFKWDEKKQKLVERKMKDCQ